MPSVKVLPKIARVDTAAELQTVAAGMCAGTIPIGTIKLKPATTYTLTAPLILAKLSGGAYSQLIGLTIETDGRLGGYYDDAATSMARIVASYQDGPVIASQCTRGLTLRNLKIVGASNYVSVSGSWLNAGTSSNYESRTTTEAWYTPSGTRTNRYSPSACIAIDPFGSTSQVASGDRYPSVSSSYYVGDSASTRTHIENCILQHSQVGVVAGLGVTGLSSEVAMTNCQIHGCKYGVSLCHSQAKNWQIHGMTFLGVWGVLTGAQHGAQQGPVPFVSSISGSQANYLVEHNHTVGPWIIQNGLIESLIRISPAPLGGNIGGASQAQVGPGVIRNMTINWAGNDANTTPNIHAGCAPLTFDNVAMFSGGSTKKTIVSTSTTAWSDGNLLGLGVIFRGCQIKMNDVSGTSTAADAIGLPASHVDDWIYFDNSYVVGVTVGPSNTRLIPLNGRGGL